MKTLYPPSYHALVNTKQLNIFLAGSIEMGNVWDWQKQVTDAVSPMDEVGVLFNPRRLDFDASQKQSIDNPYFATQVNWELDHIELADVVFMYLDPNTKSPISLMELGLILGDPTLRSKLVICCPEGFWRKGNVDIICARNDVHVYTDLENATKALVEVIEDMHGT